MEDILRIGVITSTHGIAGELKVYPTTDDPKRFKKLKHCILKNERETLELEVAGVKFFLYMVRIRSKEFINITLRRQLIDLNDNIDRDIFGYAVYKGYLSIQVLFLRG